MFYIKHIKHLVTQKSIPEVNYLKQLNFVY